MQELILNGQNGNKMKVPYPPDGYIADIKKSVQETEGVPIEKQTIMFLYATEAKDDDKVSQYTGTTGMLFIKVDQSSDPEPINP